MCGGRDGSDQGMIAKLGNNLIVYDRSNSVWGKVQAGFPDLEEFSHPSKDTYFVKRKYGININLGAQIASPLPIMIKENTERGEVEGMGL